MIGEEMNLVLHDSSSARTDTHTHTHTHTHTGSKGAERRGRKNEEKGQLFI